MIAIKVNNLGEKIAAVYLLEKLGFQNSMTRENITYPPHSFANFYVCFNAGQMFFSFEIPNMSKFLTFNDLLSYTSREDLVRSFTSRQFQLGDEICLNNEPQYLYKIICLGNDEQYVLLSLNNHHTQAYPVPTSSLSEFNIRLKRAFPEVRLAQKTN